MLLSIFLIGDHNRKDTEDSHAANQSENENDSSNEKSNSNEDTNIKGSKYLNFRNLSLFTVCKLCLSVQIFIRFPFFIPDFKTEFLSLQCKKLQQKLCKF